MGSPFAHLRTADTPSNRRNGTPNHLPRREPPHHIYWDGQGAGKAVHGPQWCGFRSNCAGAGPASCWGVAELPAKPGRSDLARTQCPATSTARVFGQGNGGGSVEGGTAQLGLRLEGVRAEWWGRQSWGHVSPPLPNATSFHVVSRLGPSGGQVRKAAELHESRVGDRLIVSAGARICPPGQSTPDAGSLEIMCFV